MRPIVCAPPCARQSRAGPRLGPMSLRRSGLLLLTLLLLAAGALLFLHTQSQPPAPALEQPRLPEEHPEQRPPLQLESSEGRASVAQVAPAPAAAPEPPADLRAAGEQRGWQLPVGKAWWTDPLINPGGAQPAGAELEALQARERQWSDQLIALKQKRKQRLDAYCNERIAAGLAVADPQGQETLPKGKEDG